MMGYEITKKELPKYRIRQTMLEEIYPMRDLEVGYCIQIDLSDFTGKTRGQIISKFNAACRRVWKYNEKKLKIRMGIKHISVYRTS